MAVNMADITPEEIDIELPRRVQLKQFDKVLLNKHDGGLVRALILEVNPNYVLYDLDNDEKLYYRHEEFERLSRSL